MCHVHDRHDDGHPGIPSRQVVSLEARGGTGVDAGALARARHVVLVQFRRQLRISIRPICPSIRPACPSIRPICPYIRPVGPSVRPFCTRCYFTTTNMIQVGINRRRSRRVRAPRCCGLASPPAASIYSTNLSIYSTNLSIYSTSLSIYSTNLSTHTAQTGAASVEARVEEGEAADTFDATAIWNGTTGTPSSSLLFPFLHFLFPLSNPSPILEP